MRARAAWATLAALLAGAADAQIIDMRLYPAAEYTRLVIEGERLPDYRLLVVEDPPRLVLDVYTDSGDVLLDKLRDRDLSDAAYLGSIRSARYQEDRLRIVFDLADEIRHSLFSLEPVEQYGARVVLDVSPAAGAEGDSQLLSDLGFNAVQPVAPKPSPRPASADEFVVVIDPGHGGEDPGAIGKSGLQEKNIVLDIALRLARRLDKEPGITPLLTRDSDVFIPLASRVRGAQQADADLFISIHADSFTSSRPRGSSVYVLSRKGASSKLAQSLATHANLGDRIGGINDSAASDAELSDALEVIFKDGKERASRSYAQQVHSHLAAINETHGHAVHSAGFAVLKSPAVPSVLVETGFLSNPDDAQLLSDPSFRQRIAEKLAASVVEFQRQQLTVAGN